MAANHGIYHNDGLPGQVSGNWRKLGENVGRGTSIRQVHNAFMGSATHRVHILDPAYNQVGMGVVRGGDGYVYITEVFAARGSSNVRRAPRQVVRRVVRTVERAALPPRPAPVAETPTQTIGMLMDLLALDAPAPARKYIPSNRIPP